MIKSATLVGTLLMLAFGCGSAKAQSWVTVGAESDTVTSAAPITYRFGTPAGVTPQEPSAKPCTTVGGCWDAPVTGLGPVAVDTGTFGGVDPAYGTVKVLQVLQTTAAQTVTDTKPDGTSTTVTIPAWVPLTKFSFSVNVNGYSIQCSLGPAADGTMTDVSCAVDQPTAGVASTR